MAGECPLAPDWMANPFVALQSMTAHTYTKDDWEMYDALKRYDNKEITLIELKEIQEGKKS